MSHSDIPEMVALSSNIQGLGDTIDTIINMLFQIQSVFLFHYLSIY